MFPQHPSIGVPPQWRSKGAMDRHPGGTRNGGCYENIFPILLENISVGTACVL
jgi:hypothetical protein